MQTNEATLDLWNDGAIDGCRGRKARSADVTYLDGYRHGQGERKVRVVMPRRPEGYYHLPLGTFDN